MLCVAHLFISRNIGISRRINSTSFGLLLKFSVHSTSQYKKSAVTCHRGRDLHTSAILAKTILLMDSNGQNLGEMSLKRAQSKANEHSLHLVQIQEQATASPAIWKLVSGSTLPESKKTDRNNIQGNKTKPKIKELRITGKIAPQDLVWKIKKIREFLGRGHFVEVSITRKPYQKISVAEKMEIVSQIKENVREEGMLDGNPKELGKLALKCKFKPICTQNK